MAARQRGLRGRGLQLVDVLKRWNTPDTVSRLRGVGIVDCMSKEGMLSGSVMLRRWVSFGWIVSTFVVMACAWHFGTRQSGGIAPVAERMVMPELVLAQLDG